MYAALRKYAYVGVGNVNTVGGHGRFRQQAGLVKKLDRDKTKRSKQRSTEVDYLLDAQNRLTAALGRRVTIKQGRGKGKIEIEYYSQDDFDAIFDVLISME